MQWEKGPVYQWDNGTRCFAFWGHILYNLACVKGGNATGIVHVLDTDLLELSADLDKGGVHAGDHGSKYYEVP